ncbi:MAG: adenosylmethionine--8-amino-7-oxononanoate transaminase [Marinicella pacifica]
MPSDPYWIKVMDIDFDGRHIWHPYSAMPAQSNALPVVSADGVYLTLENGRRLIDGMSSWWACIHGYNHPVLNAAIQSQLSQMAHVMFGGLTHEPAISLAKRLIDITAEPLQHVFFADSGSVGVEVAMKMAAQYCFEQGFYNKKRFLTFRQGYHGDTFGAMSVCDPVTGMHHKFRRLLNNHIFIESPQCGFHQQWADHYITELEVHLSQHHEEIIAVIVEPVVQGAGGMNFYHPNYLKKARVLCDRYDVLLIFDEIATGFGRTGELFAYQHAQVVPDILVLGKALTGGYMTLSAVLTNSRVAEGINEPFMHGPTFMANPLACAVARAAIDLLLSGGWQINIKRLEKQLTRQLAACADLKGVKSVRVLGAIGVVELHQEPNWSDVQNQLVTNGVWLRPFKNLLYTMPPYIINEQQLTYLTETIYKTLSQL